MSPLRVGSLCSGYGGLELAIDAVLDTELAWVADSDPGAAAILAHRFPSVPNLGDLTAVDWSAVEPVDVLTAGFPCQDLSYAGRGAGIQEGNRSGLWYTIADAIGVLRPRLVVLENVAAITGRRPGLDVVLGDLARLGFNAQWTCLRAADVGAPHGRKRWFAVAWPAENADSATGGERRLPAPGQAPGGRARADTGRPGGTHASADAAGNQGRFGNRNDVLAGRRADGRWPATGRGAPADTPGDGWDTRRPEPARLVRGSDAAQCGDGAPANPDRAPRGRDEPGGGPSPLQGPSVPERAPQQPGRLYSGSGDQGPVADWGIYGPAIARWEAILGRPAPRPTEPGRTGERLSPRFVEFLMGLPDGWVTDVPGLSRNAQLQALGNGVVPQQAAAALRLLLPVDIGDTEAAA